MTRCDEFNRTMKRLSRWTRILILLVVICAAEAALFRDTPQAVAGVLGVIAGSLGVVTFMGAWTVLRVTHRRREGCSCGGAFIGRLAGAR